MTQVNFSGSGTDSIDNQVGKGQGLKVGTTKINFASGKIQLNDAETIGYFRTLKTKGAISNTIKSFALKSTTKCIIEFQDTFIDYNLINEWLVLKEIETELISIIRTTTGITTDIFDFNFIASDNPNFSLSIEKGTRDSDIESPFPSSLRAIDTYTKNINVQGAPKLILIGKATSGSGTASVSIEIFDPASGDWVELIPTAGIFTLVNGETKLAQLGDTISRINEPTNEQWAQTTTNSSSVVDTDNYVRQGNIFPSGDSILRIKAIVTTDTLTFSIGLHKVF